MSGGGATRLDRLLGNMGYGSRKEIQALAKAGRILLDGAPLMDAGERIALTGDLAQRMSVRGQPLDPLPGLVLMLNKPLGVTCSHKDAGPLVYDLLPARWRLRKPPISTIGRLDKDTSGLLLMTDDGGFLHRAIAPKSKVEKRYRVELARPLAGNEAGVLAQGTLLLESETTPLLPVAMTVVSDGETPVVDVVLTEGRYHQVRRMFAALGNHVTTLHRDRFGGLTLPADLAPGSFRLLSPQQMSEVFASGAAET